MQTITTLTQYVRTSDTLARPGDDEFVVMLNSLGSGQTAAAQHAHTVTAKILMGTASRPYSQRME
ncbi:diguanylate cyclase domain-containing protein [Actimicrobium antarcticum]|uniref:diguanylate cyclase domain-containing protein n=1 Tax=Actimicrobium antarcticum TaxID=1051899 RepID=UPI003CD097D3